MPHKQIASTLEETLKKIEKDLAGKTADYYLYYNAKRKEALILVSSHGVSDYLARNVSPQDVESLVAKLGLTKIQHHIEGTQIWYLLCHE